MTWFGHCIVNVTTALRTLPPAGQLMLIRDLRDFLDRQEQEPSSPTGGKNRGNFRLTGRSANGIDRSLSHAAVALELHTPTVVAFRSRRRCRVKDARSDIAPGDYALSRRTARGHFDAAVEGKSFARVYDFVTRNTGRTCARLALRSRSALRSRCSRRSSSARRSLRPGLVPGKSCLRARATRFIDQTEIAVAPVTSVDSAAWIRNCCPDGGHNNDDQASDQSSNPPALMR